jgi:nucleotide-binding universal stress UspA family protein
LLAAAREGASQLAGRLQTACAVANVACQVEVCDGDTVDTISRRCQGHDLLLLGHSAGDDTGDESLLHRLVKSSSRPVLIFPKQRSQGTAVVVAFDGSRQSARTLASLAYSGLATGRDIHVVSCHSDGLKAAELTRTACDFLKNHGIAAAGHAEQLTAAAANTLLELIDQYQADALVMGAFSKTRAHEFFFGSVTRQILHQLPCPVFMDH